MALIVMAVHDTEENGRSEFTRETLNSLSITINWNRNRMIVIDNGSYEITRSYLQSIYSISHTCIAGNFGYHIPGIKIITLPENIGTAKAINRGLALRKPGEYCIKMDNDAVVHGSNWVDIMEDVMRRMPQLGILGLKRVDIQESPTSTNPDYRSRFIEVPHEPGQRWRVVEECKQVMGTCTMLSPQLLDKLGYYYQMGGLYGFDDSLMCVRSNVAGFMNAFLHGIDIDHIDPGGGPYTEWKQKYSGEMLKRYAEEEAAYKLGVKDVYYAD